MNKAKAIAASVDRNETWRLVMLMLLTIVAYILCLSPAFAISIPIVPGIAPDSKMAQVICSIYGIIAFDVGRGLATLAICALGIGAMLGRVTWGQVVTVGAGIGVTIGAITLTFALLPVSFGASISLAKCGAQAGIAEVNSGLSYVDRFIAITR